MISGANNIAYIQLGSNMGNREKYLMLAIKEIENKNIIITKKSSIFETEAWGEKNQAAFLNCVIQVACTQNPFELLEILLDIEILFGRKRNNYSKWKERVIDLDVLFYNSAIINNKNLIVPHPQIQYRKFVLIPLNEIASNFIHPILNKPINQMLLDCTDNLSVIKIKDFFNDLPII